MLTPIFKLEYNHKNITEDVSDYVVTIEYSDFEQGQSDEITITFEDTEGLWNGAWIPSKGDALRLYIGYAGEKLLNCGIFEIDEIEYNTPPDTLIVKALATGIKKRDRTFLAKPRLLSKHHEMDVLASLVSWHDMEPFKGRKAVLGG